MSSFDPDFYRRYRPYYPPGTFHRFSQTLKNLGFSEPFQIADVGCGTGHSAVSLLRTGIQGKLIGVDPDPGMLEQAKVLTQSLSIHFQLGSGEQTGLDSQSLDAVIIGSAFHWMDSQKTKEELFRILKPNGLVRIMEYQFPKATDHPNLNEWIRRQFNLNWKAPGQKPRGAFLSLMSGFTKDQRFYQTGFGSPQMVQSLTPDDLLGLIWSQSRVLCYLKTLSEKEREIYYDKIRNKILDEFVRTSLDFDFKLQWVEFAKANC